MKIDVIPNRLEKYVAFILNKNLVFIASMQFMNSSLEKLFKNLSDNLSSVRDGTAGDDGEVLDGQVSDENYLMCNKIWSEFNLKNMGCY